MTRCQLMIIQRQNVCWEDPVSALHNLSLAITLRSGEEVIDLFLISLHLSLYSYRFLVVSIYLFIYLFSLSLCKNEIERCPQLVTVFFCYLQENPVFWGFLGNRLLSHNTCVVEQLWVVALIFNNWQLYSFFSSESHYCEVVRQLIKSSFFFLKKCCGIKLLAVVFAFNRYESEIGFLI